MIEVNEEILNQHVNKIVDITKGIEYGKLSVLVGPNGVGKSLIRKQMTVRLERDFGPDTTKRVRQISMQLRTSANVAYGALCRMANDNDTTPTSICTYDLVQEATRGIENDGKNHFFVFDEPDIGMSKESELGIAIAIIGKKQHIEQKALGGLVITHSEDIVKMLVGAGCPFYYLGYNETHNDIHKWLGREIIPTDFEWLEKWSSGLFCAARDYKK